MLHNRPFHTFNKDNIEHVIQVKQGRVECVLLYLANMTSHSRDFRRFSIKAVGYAMLANFKTTISLFLGNVLLYLWLRLMVINNTDILTNLGNDSLWHLNNVFIKYQLPLFSVYKSEFVVPLNTVLCLGRYFSGAEESL